MSMLTCMLKCWGYTAHIAAPLPPKSRARSSSGHCNPSSCSCCALVCRDPRYAEGGERPLGALALAHTTPLETRAAVPPPGPGGPTGPRERHTWDAGRLIACADLLCSIPTCCRCAPLDAHLVAA